MQIVYFNPRPRKEGDIISAISVADEKISIHALVKRATAFATEITVMLTISIHALVKRATMPKKTIKDYVKISIHALVKRAT